MQLWNRIDDESAAEAMIPFFFLSGVEGFLTGSFNFQGAEWYRLVTES